MLLSELDSYLGIRKEKIMKKLGLLLIFYLLTFPIYAECVIKFRVEEYTPFTMKNEKGDWTGIFAEQAKAVIEEAGCTIAYRTVPWSRALILLQEGKLDMLAQMSITEERKKFTNFIGPHYEEQIKLLIKETKSFQIQKHEDLLQLPKHIQITKGAWYGERMNQLIQDNLDKFRFNQSTLSSFEKVRFDRVSGWILPVTPGIHKLDEYQGFKYHPFVIHSNPVYFGLSKLSVEPALVQRLQDSLERVKQRGEFEKILQKYE